MSSLKHQQYNRIKDIIENKKNDLTHLEVINNLIENFIKNYGVCCLSKSLNKLKEKNL